MTDSKGVDEGGSPPAGDLFEWDAVPPEPGEGHGLPDWYPREDDKEDPGTGPTPPEPTPPPQPWWSKSVSFPGAWHVIALIVILALGLSKVVALLVLAHIDLAAAHAGIATGILVYGFVLLLSGLGMRWTAWGFGLGQVLRPDLYDEIGLWLLRLGTIMSFIGSLAVIGIKYL